MCMSPQPFPNLLFYYTPLHLGILRDKTMDDKNTVDLNYWLKSLDT